MRKKEDYFISYIENYFKLSDNEKDKLISTIDDERFQKYLIRLKGLKEKKEQEEEIHFLKYGE